MMQLTVSVINHAANGSPKARVYHTKLRRLRRENEHISPKHEIHYALTSDIISFSQGNVVEICRKKRSIR